MPIHKSTEIAKSSLIDSCLLPHAPTAFGRISPSRNKPLSASSIPIIIK